MQSRGDRGNNARRKRSPSPARRRGGQREARRPVRIDRHECRRQAVEFLIHFDSTQPVLSEAENEKAVLAHLRRQAMDLEFYEFTREILRGLLNRRQFMIIADRWIMGILDDEIQATLHVEELSILRTAAFELLTHPEIPTTVVINEVNVLSKMFCPSESSLIHAAVNRMIETQATLGAELSEGVVGPRASDDPTQVRHASGGIAAEMGVGLDPQAQLALMLLEQQQRQNKRKRKIANGRAARYERSASRSRSPSARSTSPPPSRRSPSPQRAEPAAHVPAEPVQAQVAVIQEPEEATDLSTFLQGANKRPAALVTKQLLVQTARPATTSPRAQASSPRRASSAAAAVRVDASTQTVKDPMMESGVRVYRIRAYSKY